MYSFHNLEPVCCSMSNSNCCFLTSLQISQEAGKVFGIPISFRIFHSLLWSTKRRWCSQWSRSFSELLLFLWSSGCWQFDLCFLCFFKSSLNIWKFSVHKLLKPHLENFEHYFASVWDECNCAVVWTFFGTAFLWDWNENWPFLSPVAVAEFSKFAGILTAAL